jgi:hypothetical protein
MLLLLPVDRRNEELFAETKQLAAEKEQLGKEKERLGEELLAETNAKLGIQKALTNLKLQEQELKALKESLNPKKCSSCGTCS